MQLVFTFPAALLAVPGLFLHVNFTLADALVPAGILLTLRIN